MELLAIIFLAAGVALFIIGIILIIASRPNRYRMVRQFGTILLRIAESLDP